MATILALIPPNSYSVDTFDLSGNLLTIVPTGLTQYSQLISLNLASNLITAVRAGDLTLSAAVVSLDLSSNQMTTIASGSLPSEWLNYNYLLDLIILLKFLMFTATYASSATVVLDNNQLTSFSSTVFQPILDAFIASTETGLTISVNGSKNRITY